MPNADTPDRTRTQRLLDLTLALNSTMDPDRLLNLIVERAADLLDCEAASLLIYNESAETLQFLAATGTASKNLETMDVPLTGSLAGSIFLGNRPLVIDNTAADDRHFNQIDDAVGFETRTLVGVPMPIEGRPTGVLKGINKRNGSFEESDVEMLSDIAAQAAIALRNARQLAAIREAHAALQELNTLRTHILAITSHELRTPLATILGYSDLLIEEAPADLTLLVDEVARAGRRMQDVIDMMTDLLDLLNGDVDADTSWPVDLLALLERVVARLTGAQRNRIELDIPTGSVTRLGHERYLERTLASLIDNALRFSESDTFVQVRVAVAREITIEIEDEGIGLDVEEMDRIFEAFYQVEHHLARSYEGLGLGLTLAREVARLHGGRLDARSAGRGQGTCFTLTLPAH